MWYYVIELLSTTWLRFQSFSWLYTGRKAITTRNSTISYVKLLTPAAMVDNLAEKVNKCPLNQGGYVLFAYNWGHEKVSVIRSSGVSAIQGFLMSVENSQDFQGCPQRSTV